MGNEDSPCSGADQGSGVLHGNADIILNVDGNSDELMILDYRTMSGIVTADTYISLPGGNSQA
jgi:hypothetical protein